MPHEPAAVPHGWHTHVNQALHHESAPPACIKVLNNVGILFHGSDSGGCKPFDQHGGATPHSGGLEELNEALAPGRHPEPPIRAQIKARSLPVGNIHLCSQGVPVDCFFVRCNGALVATGDTVQHGAVYTLEPRLRGGKGGFGSMLRALGAQIEKTTNREACRDLSGRRLRDVNHEKAFSSSFFMCCTLTVMTALLALHSCGPSLLGMQAASSKLVSAETGEPRIRPRRPDTDPGPHARKRKCLWLGMENLETEEVSSDEDSETAPAATGLSCSAPEGGRGSAVMTAESPCCSQSVGAAGAGAAAPAEPEGQLTDPGAGIAEAREAPTEECQGEEVGGKAEEIQGRKETESREPAEDTAAARLTEGQEAAGVADGGRAALVERGEDTPSARPERGPAGHAVPGQGALDLLAFGSASELEQLGLERLKWELTLRGLKCGGALQERAARLFSVRGLAPEQIDPALFAKPGRGKRK
ncbi:PREDICTED: protein SDE2 homolog [Dipodomys ordii]|uniref:Replication stress response regulator SDE2 n=1 Tax=Dipodomys ordii TaxID=10020 RepID=A0A1S3F9K1_DIPOR|nr:PREDICTED: protein SDE2 homolog [Dipodomys ordii]